MKPPAASTPQAVGNLGPATTMHHSRAPFSVLCESSIPGSREHGQDTNGALEFGVLN